MGPLHAEILEQHLPGILDVLLDLDEESDGLPPIKQSVVVCEREVHHLYHWSASVPPARQLDLPA
jgi:hypothetical protein